MDELVLQTSLKTKSNSIILAEMLVEGGFFENGAIKQCLPNSETYGIVPNCYVNWVRKVVFYLYFYTH